MFYLADFLGFYQKYFLKRNYEETKKKKFRRILDFFLIYMSKFSFNRTIIYCLQIKFLIF